MAQADARLGAKITEPVVTPKLRPLHHPEIVPIALTHSQIMKPMIIARVRRGTTIGTDAATTWVVVIPVGAATTVGRNATSGTIGTTAIIALAVLAMCGVAGVR